MSVFTLGSNEIDKHWDEIAPHLYRLQRLGHIGVDEMREQLKGALRQLWGYHEDGKVIGLTITRMAGKTCEIVAAVGKQTNAGQIEETYREIERWAKSVGCERIRVIGRRGWLRKFPEFQQTGIVMEKDLI